MKPILLLLVLAATAMPALGGVGEANVITDIVRLEGVEVSLMVLPDGSGTPFSEAMMFSGGTVDASMELLIGTEVHAFIPNLPASEISLQAADNAIGVVQGCPEPSDWGLTPLVGTDDQGHVFFDDPLSGGGWCEGPMFMMIAGNTYVIAGPDSQGPVFDIRFNSPDVNGDLQVNLSDIAVFTQDLRGEYRYRSDFVWDGVINLSDIVRMTQGIGTNCE